MKQTSRKNEKNQNDHTRLEGKTDNANQPEAISHRATNHQADNADSSGSADKDDRATEVTRIAEGRPGSFGIDDF